MAASTSSVDSIYQQARVMAVNFDFKPEERINEGALATRLGTSRTPVREALNRLSAEGFLTFQTGRGFFNRALNPQEILDLYDARQAVECHAIRLAAERATDNDIKELQVYLDAAAAAIDENCKKNYSNIRFTRLRSVYFDTTSIFLLSTTSGE